MFLIFLVAGTTFLTYFSNSAAEMVKEALSTSVADYILDLLHIKSIKSDLEYYENPKYYYTLHRAQNDASYQLTQIIENFAQIIQSSIFLVATLGLITSLSWIVGIALTITAVPVAFISLIYSKRIHHWKLTCTVKERKIWYFHWLLTSDCNAK